MLAKFSWGRGLLFFGWGMGGSGCRPAGRHIQWLDRFSNAFALWASHNEINDVVRYARGSKATGIDAGTYGAIVGINPTANLLTVEKSFGEQATYDPRRLIGVSVYREIDREFSVGDRIQFAASDKSLGVANRDLAVIESISAEGHISARLDNNRQVEFNVNEHRHFDHGYAVTSHSSQGLTAERVLVNADTGVHPDLLNSRFGYVSISRASHEAILFTDDMNKLSPQLSADVSKTSALEIGQSLSIAQGISMGNYCLAGWSTFTPPHHAANAALCGLFLLRRVHCTVCLPTAVASSLRP